MAYSFQSFFKPAGTPHWMGLQPEGHSVGSLEAAALEDIGEKGCYKPKTYHAIQI